MANWIVYQGGRWEVREDDLDRLRNVALDQIEAVAGMTGDEVLATIRGVDTSDRLGTRDQRLAVAVLLWAARIRAEDDPGRFADFYADLVTGDIDWDSDEPEPEPGESEDVAPDPTSADSAAAGGSAPVLA